MRTLGVFLMGFSLAEATNAQGEAVLLWVVAFALLALFCNAKES